MYEYVIAFILLVASAFYFWNKKNQHYYSEPLPSTDLVGKSVFITGCDTGFGELTSKELYQKGFRVYSGCLSEASVEKLREYANANPSGAGKLIPIKCDVTNEAEVENTRKIVADDNPEGLWALVNNAGLGGSGPIEWTPVSYYRKVLDVNFFGHITVTKAFLPLVRKGKGRVVNVTSVAGSLATARMSAYCTSKYALEAFNDSLRREMYEFGVKVINIAPGFMRTAIIDQGHIAASNFWGNLSQDLKDVYTQEYYDKIVRRQAFTNKVAEDPAVVVSAISKAISVKHPRAKYVLGKGMDVLFIILSLAPTWFIDGMLRSREATTSAPPKKSTE